MVELRKELPLSDFILLDRVLKLTLIPPVLPIKNWLHKELWRWRNGFLKIHYWCYSHAQHFDKGLWLIPLNINIRGEGGRCQHHFHKGVIGIKITNLFSIADDWQWERHCVHMNPNWVRVAVQYFASLILLPYGTPRKWKIR